MKVMIVQAGQHGASGRIEHSVARLAAGSRADGRDAVPHDPHVRFAGPDAGPPHHQARHRDHRLPGHPLAPPTGRPARFA